MKTASRLWTTLLVLDTAALVGVARLHRAWMTRLMRALTHAGDATGWVVMGFLLLAMGGRGPALAVFLWTGAAVATVASQVLKRVWRRPRPSSGIEGFRALTENPDAFSFPSGHTTAAFAVAVALSGQGTALEAVTFPLAAGIGLSRVYLGAHYPLDVAVGVFLGLLCGALARTAALMVGL